MQVPHSSLELIGDGTLELQGGSSISIGNGLSGMSRRVTKKPTIQLLLFEDAWADGDNHNKARDNQRHRNKRYQEDAASAGGKFTSNDPVLSSYISTPRSHMPACTYLAFKVPPSSHHEYHDGNS